MFLLEVKISKNDTLISMTKRIENKERTLIISNDARSGYLATTLFGRHT